MCCRKRQHELRKQLAQTEQSAAEGADDKSQQLSQQLRVVSRILDVVDQLDMSHETFKDAEQ